MRDDIIDYTLFLGGAVSDLHNNNTFRTLKQRSERLLALKPVTSLNKTHFHLARYYFFEAIT